MDRNRLVVKRAAVALELGHESHEQTAIELLGAPTPSGTISSRLRVHTFQLGESTETDCSPVSERLRCHVRPVLSRTRTLERQCDNKRRRTTKAEYDGIAFAGRADLVLRRGDRTVEIVDHKITNNVRDRRTLQHDQQLNLYGWFAHQEWPWARRVLATHHYPPASTTVTVELTDATMESTMRDLAATARRAAADTEYRATPGPHCGHCRWAHQCPDAIDPDSYSQATDPQTR